MSAGKAGPRGPIPFGYKRLEGKPGFLEVDQVVGKSAHGKAGKVAYYEHGWSTKKGAFVPGLRRQCAPYQVLAKQFEPALWAEVLKLFDSPTSGKLILGEAKRARERNPESRELGKWNGTILSASQQLELLAERLTSLPTSISPSPIYRQMEKLEEWRCEAEGEVSRIKACGVLKDGSLNAEMGPKGQKKRAGTLVSSPDSENRQVFCSNTCEIGSGCRG